MFSNCGQNIIKMLSKYDQNVVKMWSKHGQIMVEFFRCKIQFFGERRCWCSDVRKRSAIFVWITESSSSLLFERRNVRDSKWHQSKFTRRSSAGSPNSFQVILEQNLNKNGGKFLPKIHLNHDFRMGTFSVNYSFFDIFKVIIGHWIWSMLSFFMACLDSIEYYLISILI